ncbi:hypothetical protein H8958_000552 [Nasalis larvatus]
MGADGKMQGLVSVPTGQMRRGGGLTPVPGRSLKERKALVRIQSFLASSDQTRVQLRGKDRKDRLSLQYSEEDCAFEEEIRPDGYNVYRSEKHRLPISLSSAKQRQLYKNRGFLPFSHFLPMLPMAPEEPEDLRGHLESDMFSSPLETDSMDPFGLVTGLEAEQPEDRQWF